MTGLHDKDVRLDDNWQLTQAADGDAPVCSDLDCFMQNIAAEAVTQEGDLFYDPDFGWSLCDYIQSENTELTRLEIAERVKRKLQKREFIAPGSVDVSVQWEDDVFKIHCAFKIIEQQTVNTLDVVVDSISVEVTNVD